VSSPGTSDRYRVAALAKGLQVLRQIADLDRSVRLTELAALTDIPTATLFRIVATLEHEGYLYRDEDSGYRPAIAVLRLGFAGLRASGIVGAATAPIKALSSVLGETVNLGVLHGDRVLYLIRVRNRDLVTAHIEVGSSLPAASTSIGKLLLAALPPGRVRQVVTQNSLDDAHGPNAARTLEELERRLAAIRAAGSAIQDEEVASGLRSVAAPVYDANYGVVAGINIAVSAGRYSTEELESKLRPELLRTAQEISANLGARPAELNAMTTMGRSTSTLQHRN
jgi:IclR family transcriptional regulator, pca regulon regulatory protein